MSTDLLHDYAVVFGTDPGQRVLADIRREGHVTSALALGHPVDPYLMAVNEGARRLAMLIEGKNVKGRDAKQHEETLRAISSLTEDGR